MSKDQAEGMEIIRDKAIELYAANGSEVRVFGKVKVEISIKIDNEERVANCTMLIIGESTVPALIGSDICALFQLGVFCPDRLVFADKIGMINAVVNRPILSERKQERGGVLTKTRIITPKLSKIFIPANFKGRIENKQDVTVSAYNNGHTDFTICRSICSVIDNESGIKLVNLTKKPVVIDKNQREKPSNEAKAKNHNYVQ